MPQGTMIGRDPVEPSAVRGQVERIAASSQFAGADRLLRFLRYVVEEELAGRGPSIKEYRIGLDVFARPETYDPRLDATVRVEASKLRLRLARYYQAEGGNDPLVISVPKGAYVPQFGRREVIKPPVEPPQRVWTHRRFAALALALLAGACLLPVYVYSRAPSSSPAPRILPLTTYPGSELHPSFAPDGKQVAFAWNSDGGDRYSIFIKLVETGAPLRLTHSAGTDLSPSWSPDGAALAFLRTSKEDAGVYLVPALGGSERRLADLSPSRPDAPSRQLDWGRKFLAVVNRPSPEEPFAVYLLSQPGGEKKRLTFPPPGFSGDTDPAFSPSGQYLAFRRSNHTFVDDLYVVATAGGEPRRLTFDQRRISGLAWTADGSQIVFSSNRQGSFSLWRIPIGGGSPAPVIGTGQDAVFPAISSRGSRLVYTYAPTDDANIWRLSGSGGPPVKLIASTRADSSPQISPRGDRIAFASNRSGNHEIWVSGADGSNPVQVTSFGGPLTGTPRWSPDGRSLAFDSRPHGHADIYTINAEGGPIKRLTSEPCADVVPSWSRDGSVIYFASDRSGVFQVWKIPAHGGTATPVTRLGGFSPFESPDGRFVYYAKGSASAGVWRVPVDGGEEVLVTGSLKPGLWGYWALGGAGLYYVDSVSPPVLKFLRFPNGSESRIATLPKPPISGVPGLAVSPDGFWILYAQIDQRNSDLMLVENFR